MDRKISELRNEKDELVGVDLQFQVIKASDLSRGDMVLIKCPESQRKMVSVWADGFFKPYKVQVGIITPEMNIEIVRECNGLRSEGIWRRLND